MARARVRAAGGLAAVRYGLAKGREAGGLLRLYRRLRTSNACKTCALGMGGQRGGMVDESGRFPQVCKKSIQAQAGDMAKALSENYLRGSSLKELAALGSAGFERLGRLAFPLIAGPGDSHFRRIGWQQALERAAAAFSAAAAEEVFFYSSGRASNEAAFLMQLVARAFGTNNINNCSYYCHSASSVGLSMAYGSGTASLTLDDLDHADLAVVVGANPASNHPRLITRLVELRRRGGKVIIVNPMRELGLERFRLPSDWRSLIFGSQVSDLYLQPHIGGDGALFKALLEGVVGSGGVDDDFVAGHSNGFKEVLADLAGSERARLERICGVERGDIDCAVEMINSSTRGVIMWAMGVTHHERGVDNVLALANLAMARGWLGKTGAGLLPLRGHSNVQGVGSCGVAPALKQAFAGRIEEIYGFKLPVAEGQDTYASMEAAHGGRIKAAFLLGGNLFASNPDRAWAAEALGNISTTVYVSTKLNEGHVLGRGRTTIILPALARDEEGQATTQESMFNLVRLSTGGRPNLEGEMRSEVDIIAAFAERILPAERFNWSELRSHRALREAMAEAVPGYRAASAIDRGGGEFRVEGRTFHSPRFATSDGRARFHVTATSGFEPPEGAMRMMTLRSEGQFNTVVYDQEDLYRGNRRRDVLMVSAADARALGLGEGDGVVVENEVGSLELAAAIVDIRPGNLAMYYPEANALVPRRLDPRSRTPAFKSVAVRVRPVTAR